MKVALMQPQFLPHIRYFELIAHSDRFVFLDDFQFSNQSWHHRTKFNINGKPKMMGFPVVEKFKPMNETELNYDLLWQDKMLKTIEQNYCKTPYFLDFFPYIKHLLKLQFEDVASFNMCGILTVCHLLGILQSKQIMFSSQLNAIGHRSKHVINILNEIGATEYLCAKGSIKYMDEDGWDWPGTVLIQNHEPIPYGENFQPYLSVFDSLMKVGIDGTLLAIDGTKKWEAKP